MPFQELYPVIAGFAALLALVVGLFVLGQRRKEIAELGARFYKAETARAHAEAARAALERETATLAAQLDGLDDRLARQEAAQAEERAAAARLAAARDAALTAHAGLEASTAALQRALDAERARAEAARAETAELRDRLSALDATLAARTEALRQEREAAAQKLALLENARERMALEFKDLADQALRRHGEDFKKSNEEKLTLVLAPLKEHLGGFERQLREVHAAAARERHELTAEIKSLTARSEAVSREAENLARALKGDSQKQGAWGEMILASLLEQSGLREGEEYEVQVHHRAEDGRALRPDVVVRLPENRSLVIDSKVSLTAYEEAVNAIDDTARAAAVKRHVVSVRGHIDALSAKDYHRLDAGAADYVIMFMPIESALSEALRARGDLTAYAAEKRVMIATPTTLMMTLRTIENVWTVVRRNRNAEEIARRAGLLYDKVANFVDDVSAVGAHLDKARTAHDSALDKLSRGRGNMLGQLEKLKDLGARSQKSIGVEFDPEPAEPEAAPEPLAAPRERLQ